MTDSPAPLHSPGSLTHQRADGAVHMVDVSAKGETKRVAVAQAVLITRADVVDLLVSGNLPKGEALAQARIAGILAAKQTSSLIPLCHPLFLTGADVDFVATGDRVRIQATVSTTGKTGVEMEALTAATIAALTLYDMVKAVDRAAVITDVTLLSKSGGASGTYTREVP
ncbi:MAG: cyclic pyranopterin monophosphate synthase MoaC [Mycetocola sp.]